MSKKPLTLSIVIPAFNEERYLKTCLESISRQTVKPDEVIVVDNNSTDKTGEIARRFDFVKVLIESHQGIVHARNAGFSASNGDIIGRIDADSVLPTDWVEHVKNFYSSKVNQHVALAGGPDFKDVRFARLVNFAYSFLVFQINRLLIGHPTLWGSNMAITAYQWKIVKDKVHTRTDIHEDLDLAMHLHSNNFRVFYNRRLKVEAHLRPLDSNWRRLWDYLNWWPRNLRLHKKKTWPICWLVSAGLFAATIVFRRLVR